MKPKPSPKASVVARIFLSCGIGAALLPTRDRSTDRLELSHSLLALGERILPLSLALEQSLAAITPGGSCRCVALVQQRHIRPSFRRVIADEGSRTRQPVALDHPEQDALLFGTNDRLNQLQRCLVGGLVLQVIQRLWATPSHKVKGRPGD